MRLFLTLCSFATVAFAKPQYNYGSGISGSFGSVSHGGNTGIGAGGLLGAPSHQQSSFSSSVLQSGGQSGFSSGGLSTGLGFGAANGGHAGFNNAGNSVFSNNGFPAVGNSGFSASGSNSGFNAGNSGFSAASNYVGSNTGSSTFEAPLVHKQFISISAPEDNDNIESSKHLVLGRPQKNYRVVFIKAPSASSANVKLSAEYAPKEEKTVIYVLTKKDSSLEVNDIATPAPTVPSKPEVFFIKYKTEQEAQHAQQEIQAQYDRIEGTSEHVNGGVAPQKSVVGILDGVNGGHQHGTNSQFGQENSSFVHSATNNKATAYLPPSH